MPIITMPINTIAIVIIFVIAIAIASTITMPIIAILTATTIFTMIAITIATSPFLIAMAVSMCDIFPSKGGGQPLETVFCSPTKCLPEDG